MGRLVVVDVSIVVVDDVDADVDVDVDADVDVDVDVDADVDESDDCFEVLGEVDFDVEEEDMGGFDLSDGKMNGGDAWIKDTYRPRIIMLIT